MYSNSALITSFHFVQRSLNLKKENTNLFYINIYLNYHRKLSLSIWIYQRHLGSGQYHTR